MALKVQLILSGPQACFSMAVAVKSQILRGKIGLFSFSALLPSQRSCSLGEEMSKGCRQAGEWDEQSREG